VNEIQLEQRLQEFAVSPDDGDWNEVIRKAGGARRIPRRRLVLALALAVCVVIAVPAVVLGLRSNGGSHSSGGGGPAGPATVRVPDGSNLWGQYGRQISIDDLRAEAPYVPLPDSPLANDSNVGTVWVWDHTSDPRTPVDHVAAVVYYPASGIELLWTGTGFDYSGFPSRMIDGVRASLLPRDWSAKGPTGATGTAANGPSVSSLRLPVGADETLTLDGVVAENELIDVARTLSPSPGLASPSGALPPADPQPGPYLTFWDRSPIYAPSQGSVDDAAASLAFKPVAPPSLGDPSAIVATDPSHAPASGRVLSLRYDDSSEGRFWLLERPSLSTTTALLREIASDCMRVTGCKDTATMLDLGHGVSALGLADPVSQRIVWVQNGVYYEITGSTSRFSSPDIVSMAGDAISVAKTVAAAAAG
jgi:hypothetical protein